MSNDPHTTETLSFKLTYRQRELVTAGLYMLANDVANLSDRDFRELWGHRCDPHFEPSQDEPTEQDRMVNQIMDENARLEGMAVWIITAVNEHTIDHHYAYGEKTFLEEQFCRYYAEMGYNKETCRIAVEHIGYTNDPHLWSLCNRTLEDFHHIDSTINQRDVDTEFADVEVPDMIQGSGRATFTL